MKFKLTILILGLCTNSAWSTNEVYLFNAGPIYHYIPETPQKSFWGGEASVWMTEDPPVSFGLSIGFEKPNAQTLTLYQEGGIAALAGVSLGISESFKAGAKTPEFGFRLTFFANFLVGAGYRLSTESPKATIPFYIKIPYIMGSGNIQP